MAFVEAEVEYQENSSPSIFTQITVGEGSWNFSQISRNLFPCKIFKIEKFFAKANRFSVLRTMTAETLPANLTIAFHSKVAYVWITIFNKYFVFAAACVQKFSNKCRVAIVTLFSQIMYTGQTCAQKAPGSGLEDCCPMDVDDYYVSDGQLLNVNRCCRYWQWSHRCINIPLLATEDVDHFSRHRPTSSEET
jgi:hypothetical protein